MSLLLDSHTVLWWVDDDPALPRSVRSAIRAADRVLVSVVTPWELGIKATLGRLRSPPLAVIRATLAKDVMAELGVRWEHADEVTRLPLHHGDPFDRLLVAQARVERLTLVTRDPLIRRYDVDTLWA